MVLPHFSRKDKKVSVKAIRMIFSNREACYRDMPRLCSNCSKSIDLGKHCFLKKKTFTEGTWVLKAIFLNKKAKKSAVGEISDFFLVQEA